MPAVSAPAQVLVTGASGFLGAHVSRAFLARGYNVRGTVRSPSKGEYLVNLFNKDYPGKFSYTIVKEITAPGAFDEAVEGVEAIAHTASPLEIVADDVEPEVLIEPAVKGTTGIFESAYKHGDKVKRIVVTSSVSSHDSIAIPAPYTYTSKDWNDNSVEECKKKGAGAHYYQKYCASKTLGERAAWDFLKNHPDAKFDAVTCNPPWLYAPPIHEVASADKVNMSIKKMLGHLSDPEPKNDDELTEWVGDHFDARDVAELHVDAISHEELAGRRLLVSNGPLTRQDFLDAAHRVEGKLPKLPFKIPVGKPGIGDKNRAQFYRFANEGGELLGKKWHTLDEIILDTLNGLAERNLL